MKGYYTSLIAWAKKYGHKPIKAWHAAALCGASYYAGHYGYGWEWVQYTIETVKGLW